MNVEIVKILDVLMAEYGWTIDYTMKLPITMIQDLYKIIVERQTEEYKLQTKLQAMAIGAAFSKDGFKMIEKAFNGDELDSEETAIEEFDEEAHKGQMKSIWVKMGKKPEDFDEAYSKGEVKF